MRLVRSSDKQSFRDTPLRIASEVWTGEALKRLIDELIVPALVNEYLRKVNSLPEADTHEP